MKVRQSSRDLGDRERLQRLDTLKVDFQGIVPLRFCPTAKQGREPFQRGYARMHSDFPREQTHLTLGGGRATRKIVVAQLALGDYEC